LRPCPPGNCSIDAAFDFLVLGDYSLLTTSQMFSAIFGLNTSHGFNIAYKPHPSHPYIPTQLPQHCLLTINNDSISSLCNCSTYVVVSSSSSAIVDCLLCNINPLIFNSTAVNPCFLSSQTYPFFFSNSSELEQLFENYSSLPKESSKDLAFTSDDYSRWTNFLSTTLVSDR